MAVRDFNPNFSELLWHDKVIGLGEEVGEVVVQRGGEPLLVVFVLQWREIESGNECSVVCVIAGAKRKWFMAELAEMRLTCRLMELTHVKDLIGVKVFGLDIGKDGLGVGEGIR